MKTFFLIISCIISVNAQVNNPFSACEQPERDAMTPSTIFNTQTLEDKITACFSVNENDSKVLLDVETLSTLLESDNPSACGKILEEVSTILYNRTNNGKSEHTAIPVVIAVACDQNTLISLQNSWLALPDIEDDLCCCNKDIRTIFNQYVTKSGSIILEIGDYFDAIHFFCLKINPEEYYPLLQINIFQHPE